MNALAPIISWLFQLTPNFALWLSVRDMLADILRLLFDPETCEVRPINPGRHHDFEACLQLGQVSIERLIWLRARQMRGLPSPGRPEAFRYLPPRHLSNALTVLTRAAELLDRLIRMDELATRLCARFDRIELPAHAIEHTHKPRAQHVILSTKTQHQTDPPQAPEPAAQRLRLKAPSF